VPLLSFSRNNTFLIGALSLLLSACSSSLYFSPEEFQVFVSETNIWNDVMPGSPEKCHALMTVQITNLMGSPLAIYPTEGLIVDAKSGFPLRRFPLECRFQDVVTKEVNAKPMQPITISVRSQLPLAPIDIRQYPRVRFLAHFRTTTTRTLRFHSPTTDLFVTQ